QDQSEESNSRLLLGRTGICSRPVRSRSRVVWPAALVWCGVFRYRSQTAEGIPALDRQSLTSSCPRGNRKPATRGRRLLPAGFEDRSGRTVRTQSIGPRFGQRKQEG